MVSDGVPAEAHADNARASSGHLTDREYTAYPACNRCDYPRFHLVPPRVAGCNAACGGDAHKLASSRHCSIIIGCMYVCVHKLMPAKQGKATAIAAVGVMA